MKKKLTFSVVFFLFLFAGSVFAQLFEDFEQGTKNYYAYGQDMLGTGEWTFDDALIGTAAGDKKNGLKSARIRNGYIEMNFDYPNGFSEISFYAANFGTDGGGVVELSYSTDSGGNWISLGAPVSLTDELLPYTISESVEGDIRLRFTKTGGNRINVDDIYVTDYIDIAPEPTLMLSINNMPFVSGETYDFGTNTGTATANLLIRNGGEEDLVITSAQIEGDAYSIDGDMNITLESLETATFPLVFNSQSPGIITGTLSIFSNDPENDPFVLHLTAETLDTSQPIPISEARQLPMGTEVTVSGWITVASQFSGPVYLQDNTGGIAWYNGALMADEWLVGAIIGDSIVLSGQIGHFNNLIQIVNDTGFEIFPESNKEIEPLDITLNQLNTGDHEGLLVRISDVEFSNEGTFAGGTNYNITDPEGEGELRVDNSTNIPGTTIPNSITEITGAAGRYQNTHQILPRFTQDIKILSGPIILSAPPYEVSATENSITFEWETEKAGHSEIRYGITPSLELGSVLYEEHTTQHSITLTGLQAATAYRVQLRSAFDADTSATSHYITTTTSPAGSTGEIQVFFNKDVVHELATFREADENVDFADKFIEFIQMAEETAEFAFYNISGDVGSLIADEIIAAQNRGVDVRVIASGHTGNVNPLITQMAESGVKAVQSIGDEQMHNKFAVFDAHHQDPSKARIITGSWNSTDQGTYNQFQNMVVVQDVALARAYWFEFNQMWGGESGEFDAAYALFGPNKSVVNPTMFWIGEESTQVELFFSPQANTEVHINRTLLTAEETIDLSLNLLTRRPISNTMLNRFEEGVEVRGVFGVISGQGNEWDYLSSWADVHHLPQGEFGLLHHKYAIVDGEVTNPGSKVITGSHNWSSNANFSNDENILIIHNQRVANEFFQEYAARYWQAGGEAEFDVTVSVEQPLNDPHSSEMVLRNYPNPLKDQTFFQFELTEPQQVSIHVFDMMGCRVANPLQAQRMEEGVHTISFDASVLPAGLYLYQLRLANGKTHTRRMSVVR